MLLIRIGTLNLLHFVFAFETIYDIEKLMQFTICFEEDIQIHDLKCWFDGSK